LVVVVAAAAAAVVDERVEVVWPFLWSLKLRLKKKEKG
jgi:hypothetical protein